jgi:hypothetical protein
MPRDVSPDSRPPKWANRANVISGIIAILTFAFTIVIPRCTRTPPEIRSFWVDHSEIQQGTSANLHWQVELGTAKHANISIEPQIADGLTPTGSVPVSPLQNTKYTLRVSAPSYSDLSKEQRITVIPKQDTAVVTPPPPPAPRFTTSPKPHQPNILRKTTTPAEGLTMRHFTLSNLVWKGNVQGSADVLLTLPSRASSGEVTGVLPGEPCRISVVEGNATLTQPGGSCQDLRFHVTGQGDTRVVFRIQLLKYSGSR